MARAIRLPLLLIYRTPFAILAAITAVLNAIGKLIVAIATFIVMMVRVYLLLAAGFLALLAVLFVFNALCTTWEVWGLHPGSRFIDHIPQSNSPTPEWSAIFDATLLLNSLWFLKVVAAAAGLYLLWYCAGSWLKRDDAATAARAEAERQHAHRVAAENARIERENREHEAAQARQRAQAEAERKSRLTTLETFMARQWADFSLSRSFTGRDDPAALRAEFQRTEVSRLDPADLALIRQTQNPAIRDVVHPANQLPPPGRS